ncbi:MAG: SPOR domain-containing protein [Sphingomonas sp.]|uniref:SPOR domain-containing protein n=1 Tax=Sphingomonas sp. TaxID=28214 RepID=UPI0026174524|nr:SPOR domain-containing protein [Sphingomonas sp.]MDK2767081.1 SPOR domain-containing protein [Sphingomonas sp.]
MSAALVAIAPGVAPRAAAQEVAPPPTPNADRLAEQMRILATDPRNVPALLAAGELSARLNDPAAAAGFFARAQALAPGNPRVAAGQAMVMVRSERPGEALRLFALAERGGVAMTPYASDRALAYDLIGAQAHAQLEHRIAMAQGGDDETARRYAYSLGISGRTDEAMKILDPLLRRSDRAAWRARAFILAMNGDAAGADRIAASMMGGVGTALAPFFRRLPALAPADKAFAVHFGELRRTPSRIADAQVAPPLPTIAPVQVAAAPPPPPPPRAAGSEFASISPERRMSARERRAQEAAAARQAAADAEAKRIADARAAQEAETRRQAEAARLAEQQRLEMERVAAAQRQAEAQRLADAERAAQAQREADARAAQERATREAEARRAAEAATASAAAPPPAATPVEVARSPEPAPEVAPQPKPRVGGEDNVIARIMAGITIPASELGVDPLPGREAEPTPAPEPQPAAAPAVAASKPKPETVAKPAAAAKVDPKAKADPKPKAKTDPKAKPKVDPAKAEPARHWVQVAGGADVKALPKAWKAAVAEAPAEFRGKQAWTTPLRFTNRLLAGPFKTPAAAQDFVNAIKKKGVSAFAWTSEAGQKIEKLDVK